MRHVLILEQEAFLGALLGERFERSGYTVRLFSGTPSPLNDGYIPDLIVVGSHQPSTLQRLHRWFTATPVIVLGAPRDTFPTRLFPTLDKPFSPNQLVELANRYLIVQRLYPAGTDLGTIPIS